MCEWPTHHPHLDLKDDAGAALASIAHGDVAHGGGGHERRFDTAANAKLVLLPKLGGQRLVSDAAVNLGRPRQLGHLHDGRVDGV